MTKSYSQNLLSQLNSKYNLVQTWRLIPHRIDCGEAQMQIDQFLLERFSQDPSLPPILRFYSWQPSAISLGLHQTKFPDHWLDLIKLHGLDLVRRPTGGRGVLHQGDICYSLIANPHCSDRTRNYQYFCQFLINGLNCLAQTLANSQSLTIDYGEKNNSYIQQPNCFAIATGADLVATYIDGDLDSDKFGQQTKICKLVGSAQVYRQGAMLQHGSILLNPELKLWQEFFGKDFSVVGLAQIFNYSPHQLPDLRQKLIANLCQAAINQFDADLIESPLSNAEFTEMGLNLNQI